MKSKSEIRAFITEQAEKSRLCGEELRTRGAADDAAIEKVEGNIWDIARTLCDLTPDDGGHVDYLHQKLNGISQPWQKRLTDAKAHDDARTVAIEERKLAAVARLMDYLHERSML